jgi:hypothetical protein
MELVPMNAAPGTVIGFVAPYPATVTLHPACVTVHDLVEVLEDGTWRHLGPPPWEVRPGKNYAFVLPTPDSFSPDHVVPH